MSENPTGLNATRELAETIGVSELAAIDLGKLRALTRRELLRAARLAGLRGVSRLRKEPLAAALGEALRRLQTATRPALKKAGREVLREKFALTRREPAPPAEHIPWSYGYDRVRAMAVDPENLFVYWEVTEPAIQKARSGLGRGSGSTWLNLRVYDTTSRLFDGTNAHSYFDHRVERQDRQWFVRVGKPASEVIVELGMKSEEGYVVRIARSGRATFPRREPALTIETEWMTVRSPTGAVEMSPPETPPPRAWESVPGDKPPLPRYDLTHTGPRWQQDLSWREGLAGDTGSVGHRSFQWEGPLNESSWQQGPFTYPVRLPEPVCERFEGGARIEQRNGRTHVIYGPWRVSVRGVAGFARRSILARWEVFRSWIVEEKRERTHAVRWRDASMIGGSGVLGASERRWGGASETRWGGASERAYLGASERSWGGASERLYAAASEWLMRGASERRFVGASELLFRGGASELTHAMPHGSRKD